MKIYRNLWAGHETYFVKVSQNKHMASGYSLVNINGKWHLNKSRYYPDSLMDVEHFPEVGNIDLNKVITGAILEAIDEN